MKKMTKVSIVSLLLISAIVFGALKTVHTIDAESCTNCGLCEETCPEGAISAGEVDGMDVFIIDPVLCTNCGECVESCPVEAISEVEMEVEAPAIADTTAVVETEAK